MARHSVRGDGGRFVSKAAAAAPSPAVGGTFEELGTTGLKQYSGIIDEEFLPQLKGLRAVATYTEMRDNDATVGAILFATEMLIRQVAWRVEPASEDQADLEAAAFLEECLEDMQETWADTLATMLSFLQYGFSIHEEVYKLRVGSVVDPTRNSRFTDGRIGWRKLPIRAQDTIQRWEFDEESGELVGAHQLAPPHFRPAFLPCAKLLHFRTSAAKNNPEGRSILRSAYKAWYRKSRIETIEGIGVERDLAGLPVAHVPPELLLANAGPDEIAQKNEIIRLLRNIRRDEKEGVLFPLEYDDAGNKVWELELLSTGSRRQFDTTKIVTRYDQRIAMSVLADFILLGMDRVGSFALASSKTTLFALALGSWLDAIGEVFNRVAVPRLFQLNAFSLEALPELVHGDVENVDLTELGAFLVALTGSGAPLFPDDALEDHLRAAAGLPPVPEHREERGRGMVSEEDLARLDAAMQARDAARARREPPPEPPPGDGEGEEELDEELEEELDDDDED